MRRSILRFAGIAALSALAIFAVATRMAGVPPLVASTRAVDPQPTALQKVALFAGGCFWSMQKAFDGVPGRRQRHRGVRRAARPNPTYEQVETGATGHAESVQVIYDPDKITYEQLLDIYWHHIDPPTPNQAFCDRGPAVPLDHLLRRRRPEARGGGVEDGARPVAPVPDAGRDRHPAGHAVLCGRGVPPAVLQEEPGALRGLPHRLPPGRSGRGSSGATVAMTKESTQ